MRLAPVEKLLVNGVQEPPSGGLSAALYEGGFGSRDIFRRIDT